MRAVASRRPGDILTSLSITNDGGLRFRGGEPIIEISDLVQIGVGCLDLIVPVSSACRAISGKQIRNG